MLIGTEKVDFAYALITKTRRAFRLTKGLRQNLHQWVGMAMASARIPGAAEPIVERFLARDFIAAYYDYQDEIRTWRAKSKAKVT